MLDYDFHFQLFLKIDLNDLEICLSDELKKLFNTKYYDIVNPQGFLHELNLNFDGDNNLKSQMVSNFEHYLKVKKFNINSEKKK